MSKEKEYTIVVNAREHTISEKKISYKEVVELAFGAGSYKENVAYTITFKKGEEKKKEGTMSKGDEIPVKDGMLFNVTATDKS